MGSSSLKIKWFYKVPTYYECVLNIIVCAKHYKAILLRHAYLPITALAALIIFSKRAAWAVRVKQFASVRNLCLVIKLVIFSNDKT